MSKFTDWLFNRRAICADLREECSLAERQASILADINAQGMMREAALEKELARKAAMVKINAQTAVKAIQDRNAAREQSDGLMRELWLERRRVEELKQRITLTDANVRCCFAAMALQQQDLRAWINRLLKDIESQKQMRIEAQGELETLKGKGATP